MQMIIPPTTSVCPERNRGNPGEFLFQKSVTPAVLEGVLGKLSAIPVCLAQSCLSHDVTRTLCYLTSFL